MRLHALLRADALIRWVELVSNDLSRDGASSTATSSYLPCRKPVLQKRGRTSSTLIPQTHGCLMTVNAAPTMKLAWNRMRPVSRIFVFCDEEARLVPRETAQKELLAPDGRPIVVLPGCSILVTKGGIASSAV